MNMSESAAEQVLDTFEAVLANVLAGLLDENR